MYSVVIWCIVNRCRFKLYSLEVLRPQWIQTNAPCPQSKCIWTYNEAFLAYFLSHLPHLYSPSVFASKTKSKNICQNRLSSSATKTKVCDAVRCAQNLSQYDIKNNNFFASKRRLKSNLCQTLPVRNFFHFVPLQNTLTLPQCTQSISFEKKIIRHAEDHTPYM